MNFAQLDNNNVAILAIQTQQLLATKIKKSNQIKLFKLSNARSGCPVSLARDYIYYICIKRSNIPGRIGILEILVFEERGKPEYPGENLLEQRKNQQQT